MFGPVQIRCQLEGQVYRRRFSHSSPHLSRPPLRKATPTTPTTTFTISASRLAARGIDSHVSITTFGRQAPRLHADRTARRYGDHGVPGDRGRPDAATAQRKPTCGPGRRPVAGLAPDRQTASVAFGAAE